MPDNDDQFVEEVARLKRLAVEHRARSYWTLAGAAITAVLVGIATWFGQGPMDRDEVHFGMVLGLGGITFFIPCLFWRIFFSRPAAKCPQCKYVWDMPQEGGHDWLTWNRCPGCGLKMSG